jgi:alpha-beta hydrolase superfamily lysophospholipase
MQSHDVRVDITGRIDLQGKLKTAATVHLPDEVDRPLTVMVGYPGGGYSRGYYDIRRLSGYSQAEHHVNRGAAFVACDHLGIGDSTPVDNFDLTIERMAAANHATASTVVERLRTGSLIEGVGPIEIEKVVGMGQSMGGCLLTVQQGLHRTFDGIAVLGYSCIGPSFPAPDGSRITFPPLPRNADLHAVGAKALSAPAAQTDLMRYCFHAADEDLELVEADMPSSPPSKSADGHDLPAWRVRMVPACAAMMMAEGAVAKEAAAIDVPVLVGCGEIDVVPDPWAEPSSYRRSRDVSVFVVPRMCHMHNFARTRELLWERLAHFAQSVAPHLKR